MICKTDISNVKTNIFDRVGQKIIVKGSLGRCKEFKKEGTLEKAYSNLFIVKYEENDRTASYTYTDLLTRNIELAVLNQGEFSPLLPPMVVQTRKRKVKELKEQPV